MDFWKFFLLIHQLAYFVYLSLVDFVKSFLEHLGLIICGNNYLCYTALTALKARDSCLWYLDNSCSRHMTGNKGLFKTLFEWKIGTVTFGDGSKSVIRGIGIVDIPRLPVFKDVWYVDGLKANLLSISQICDNGLMFSSLSMNVRYLMVEETVCVLVNEQQTIVMDWHQA